MSKDIKILLPGGAGLVGQNLVARLMAKGYTNIIVLDNMQIYVSPVAGRITLPMPML